MTTRLNRNIPRLPNAPIWASNWRISKSWAMGITYRLGNVAIWSIGKKSRNPTGIKILLYPNRRISTWARNTLGVKNCPSNWKGYSIMDAWHSITQIRLWHSCAGFVILDQGFDKMEAVICQPVGWEQEQLESWTKEYDLKFSPWFAGYVQYSDSRTMGKCYFHDFHNHNYNTINIKVKFVGRNLATKAILWHEFCHHRDCVVNDCHDHCTKYFKKYLWEKPLLALIDLFLPAWYHDLLYG